MPDNDSQNRIDQLKAELESLRIEMYRGNFSESQDFNKYSRFNTRLKVPTLAASPSTCEVGELYVNSANGKLYVCSAANTWTAQT